MDWHLILQQLFAIVIPPLAGWVATEIGVLVPAINNLGTVAAGAINVVLAFLLALGFGALGLAAPAGLSGLDAATVAAALTAVIRILFPLAAAAQAKAATRRIAR